MNTVRALCVLFVVLSETALASTAGLAVQSGPGDSSARTYQLMTLQALQDARVSMSDTAAFQHPIEREAALTATREAKFERLFILHVAPMKEGALFSFEEVDIGKGDALARATLVCARDVDAPRTLARLVTAVLGRQAVEDGQLVSTVTEGEAHAFAKRPGEFLNGFSVSGGLLAADIEEDMGLFGFGYHFRYELPHVNFGASITSSYSESSRYFDVTIRSAYLFSEGNTSAFLGGGLGFSLTSLDHYDFGIGGEAILSAGVEMFRLHAARLVIGLDIALPFYDLEGRDQHYGGWDEPATVVEGGVIYPMTVNLGLSVFF